MSQYLGREDALNWDVSRTLVTLLRKGGADVVLTRSQYQTVPLSQRMTQITSLRPDLVLSVHHNASDSKQYQGSLVIAQVADRYGGPSKSLANALERQFAALGRPVIDTLFRKNSQGTDYYAILRAAASVSVPAVITEYAYIDHATDWVAVDSAQKREAQAQAIYRATVEWFGK